MDDNADELPFHCNACNAWMDWSQPTLVCNYCCTTCHKECVTVYYIYSGSRMACANCITKFQGHIVKEEEYDSDGSDSVVYVGTNLASTTII